MMKMVDVTSSNIAAVGYDPTAMVLRVSFKSGRVYEYDGVPASIHAGLMKAASIGKYHDLHVKKGPYPFRIIL